MVNGKIWAEDDARPQVQALAVSGDKILAVGGDEEIKSLAVPDTAVIDLGEHLVVPVFKTLIPTFPEGLDEID